MSITSHPSSPGISVTRAGASRRRAAAHAIRIRLARLYLRPTAVWRAADLDRQLAAGVNPQLTAVLALRAERITSRRSRTRVADGLVRALSSARHASPGFTAAVRPQAPELIEACGVVEALSRGLRSPEPVDARGIAILRLLLTDAGSALYQRSEPGALADRLRTAAATL